MSQIITISREFGSGGRELGKRLAELMGCDYYDREIITAIARQSGLDEGYVERILEGHTWQNVPLTYRRSFSSLNAVQKTQTKLLLEQRCVIEGIAKTGKNCVIVGRSADVLLPGEGPFRMFVCAEQEAKVRRCMERAPAGESLVHRDIQQNIRRIDKSRARTRELLAGGTWGDGRTYHLTVNTTDWEIKELAPAVADFVSRWFRRTQ